MSEMNLSLSFPLPESAIEEPGSVDKEGFLAKSAGI
jgi:hypothetical protein